MPAENDSLSSDCGRIVPASSRIAASMNARAGISPPVRTKSPSEYSSYRIEPSEAIVDALVVSANDNHAIEGREPPGVLLFERLAAWAGDDDQAALVCRRPAQKAVENAGDRLDPKHHAWPAAEGRVVGALPLSKIVEQVVVAHVRDSGLDRASHDRKADEGREDFGEERDDVDLEHRAECSGIDGNLLARSRL